MRVELAYGRTWLPVELPDGITDVVIPKFIEGVPNEEEALREALRNPIGSAPVRELVKPGDTVAIVFCDGTRPMPSNRVLPPLLEELETVPDIQIVLINALGTHRRNTEEELDQILGAEIARKYKIVQSFIGEEDAYVKVGVSKAGYDVKLRKEYVDADVRIVTGFIEPHFFAGFSGGAKTGCSGSGQWGYYHESSQRRAHRRFPLGLGSVLQRGQSPFPSVNGSCPNVSSYLQSERDPQPQPRDHRVFAGDWKGPSGWYQFCAEHRDAGCSRAL